MKGHYSGRAAAFSVQRPMIAQNSEYLLKVCCLGMVNMKSGSLTPKDLHFLCLSPGDLKNGYLLCSAETVDVHPTYKDTTIGRSTAVEILDLNSQDCGNAVPNQFLQPCQLFQPLFSCECNVIVIKLISKDWRSC